MKERINDQDVGGSEESRMEEGRKTRGGNCE